MNREENIPDLPEESSAASIKNDVDVSNSESPLIRSALKHDVKMYALNVFCQIQSKFLYIHFLKILGGENRYQSFSFFSSENSKKICRAVLSEENKNMLGSFYDALTDSFVNNRKALWEMEEYVTYNLESGILPMDYLSEKSTIDLVEVLQVFGIESDQQVMQKNFWNLSNILLGYLR